MYKETVTHQRKPNVRYFTFNFTTQRDAFQLSRHPLTNNIAGKRMAVSLKHLTRAIRTWLQATYRWFEFIFFEWKTVSAENNQIIHG